MTTALEDVQGRVFEIENFATVDGPGIRSVVFLQGCPLRCVYCHNPESRSCRKGERLHAGEVLQRVSPYQVFMESSGGGLTLSGGEPLLQPRFSQAILQLAQGIGMHTAVDTSGAIPWKQAAPALEHCDLVLLDIKAGNPQLARAISGLDLALLTSFIEGLNCTSVKVWVRHVLVTGWNDQQEALDEVAAVAQGIKNLERFELLPFHQLAEEKWNRRKMLYPLAHHPETEPSVIRAASERLRTHGLPVLVE